MTDVECPYCGKDFEYECWEDTPNEFYEAQCPHCDKEFEVATEPADIYYSTVRKFEGSGDESC
ncbi:hypothetical protein [Lactococcus lactis]|uniref:hypothetical protein n=1 Tax=Lactococcus lactis TaxID=1358 RepID=UPI00117A4F7D|nr:hypothetical protein [Lactococcus lactis]TRW76297.1 hypothetical protein FNJ54_07795 [Lactococcus lactis]